MKNLLFTSILISLFCCKGNSQQSLKSVIVADKVISDKSYYVSEFDINENKFNNTNIQISNFNEINESYHSIKKKGDKLELLLKNNKKVLFKDNDGVPYDENRITYNLINDFKEINKYLIKVDEYEQTSYLLIDRDTGVTDSLAGAPFISPNQDFIFSSYYNQYEEPFPSQEIYIHNYRNEQLKLIFKHSFSGYELVSFYWKNSNELNLKLIHNSKMFFKKFIIKEKE
jgi:hypothetical protein